MAAIASRQGIGPDTKIYIGSDDRTSWFIDWQASRPAKTGSNHALGDFDETMIQTGRSAVTVTATIRTITDAVDYFEAWQDTNNDEREFHYRREGDGSGKPNVEYNMIWTDMSEGAPRDGEQTMTVTMMSSQTPTRGTQ